MTTSFFEILTSGQLLLAALITGTIYATVGLGLNLVYGTMRLLNVAHGEFLMLGAYVAFWGFTLFDISPFLSAILAGILTAALAVALYFGLLRWCLQNPRMRKRIEPNSLLMAFTTAKSSSNFGRPKRTLSAGNPRLRTRLATSTMSVMLR